MYGLDAGQANILDKEVGMSEFVLWQQYFAAAITGLCGCCIDKDGFVKTLNPRGIIAQATEIADLAVEAIERKKNEST